MAGYLYFWRKLLRFDSLTLTLHSVCKFLQAYGLYMQPRSREQADSWIVHQSPHVKWGLFYGKRSMRFSRLIFPLLLVLSTSIMGSYEKEAELLVFPERITNESTKKD